MPIINSIIGIHFYRKHFLYVTQLSICLKIFVLYELVYKKSLKILVKLKSEPEPRYNYDGYL